MSEIEQVPFHGLEFAENPEPRCPCVLVLDRSGSMAGTKIDELNAGIQTFKSEVQGDELASKRVEVAVVTFGPVEEAVSFTSAQSFEPPVLTAGSDTPMGAALLKAIELVEFRKQTYRDNGVAYYRPWVILITDGEPTDSIEAAKEKIREGEQSKKFAFFAIGVDQADMAQLATVSTRDPLKLRGHSFREFFMWLSSSMRTVSRSTPDAEKIALPSPAGWAEI